MGRGVGFCNQLASYAQRIWDESLGDLARSPLPDLLEDFRRVWRDFKEFKARCYGELSAGTYSYYESVFSIALLKLSVAIEDKVRGGEVQDEYVRFAVEMFTPDEKNAIKELERFSGIDPRVTPPEVLADIIVSRRGEVYQLVKEAVGKQYVNLADVVESWSKVYRISDSIRRGLIVRYEARFRNVVEAVKRLLDQQPAWLRRLFSEYEEVLLSSAEVRVEFEKAFREVYERELSTLRERVESLERERSNLLDRLSTLSERATSREVEARVLEEELSRLRKEYEDLRSRYLEYLKMWEDRAKELETLRSKLAEKEGELREMARREGELTAAKEALEAEVERLRNTISEYERRVEEYRKERESLLLELRTMEDRVSTIEKSLRGELKGHLVTAEEAAILELIFVEKLRSKLRELPVVIRTPWGEVSVSRWSYERIEYEHLEKDVGVPSNASVLLGYRSRGVLGLGEERVIEVRGVYLSHVDTLKKQGFDSQPATLSDLLKVLRSNLGFGEGGRRYTLIGIASPTGWEESVVRYVAGEDYSLVFRNAVVILVDLVEGRAIYPEKLSSAMPYIDRYARMFLPEVAAEEERYVEGVLRDLCDEAKAKAPESPVFLYRNLVERLKGVSRLSVMRVMSRYRERGSIEVRSIGGEKAVLCRFTG